MAVWTNSPCLQSPYRQRQFKPGTKQEGLKVILSPRAKRLDVLILCLLLAPGSLTVRRANADEAEREFTIKVLPLLKERCGGCHGKDPDDIKGEFSVLGREQLLQGGESGEPALVPGEPDAGTLYQAITWQGLEMPPKENDRLNDAQIALVRRWIERGAPWPDDARQEQYRADEKRMSVTEEGIIFSTSGGTSEAWTQRRYQPDDLWAFVPVRPKQELQVPSEQQSNVVDHFINQKCADAGLQLASKATPRALIRRATYDLTGLPPTPEEVDSFERAYLDNAQAAWTELVDRLLASERYGEHWGRHWLDVTRYADTGGMSNDYERSNLWRYRDYVIRSFNSDKPYNEFIVEQLAGDELADVSVRQRLEVDNEDKLTEQVHEIQLSGDYTPQEAEWIVASGFLRLGPWDNAMVTPEEARQIFLDDLVNITGQTFLSTTMRCVKCHDHKFDPIPTRDYYRMYAAFSTTHMAERPAPFLPQENLIGFDAGRAHVQRMLDFAVAEKNKLIDRRETAAKAWFAEHKLPYQDEAARKNLADELKPPRNVGLDHVAEGQLKVREQDEWIWNRQLERYQPMAQSVFNATQASMAWNGARKLRISRPAKAKQPVVSHILTGGALAALGDVVVPGVLSSLAVPVDVRARNPYVLTEEVDGRRLGLAHWIASPSNALATRSIVNRIWQWHFGTGLAANPNNFGAKGGKPSHPELLDYLAADFVENGWKIKRLHRLIMLSNAYQRSSTSADVELLKLKDPNNRLLSFFPKRRLSAEEVRDSALFLAGELNLEAGGLPISPEINMEVALQPRMIQFSLAPAYQPSPTRAQRNRRTVYAYQVRGQPDPFTEIFNQPNPNESCEQRESAAVTPQVFTLLNSDMMTDRSIAMALRIEAERKEAAEQVERAFALTYGRQASAAERERLCHYLVDMTAYHQTALVQPTTYPISITRSLVEEFSGRVFEYEEILPIFEHYEADVKPADVPASTRALADLCLLLLNSNEFMYLE